MSDSLFGVTPT